MFHVQHVLVCRQEAYNRTTQAQELLAQSLSAKDKRIALLEKQWRQQEITNKPLMVRPCTHQLQFGPSKVGALLALPGLRPSTACWNG